MRKVVSVGLTLALVVLAGFLVPSTAIGQTSDSNNYQLRRLAAHGLYARGYAAEAFVILDALGDAALAAGDTAGAIQAFHDAAWIAGDAAKQANAMLDPKMSGIGADRGPKPAALEAQRVLGKATAIGGSDSPQMAPLQLNRDVENPEVGLDVGRILDAIGEPYLATLVFEIVGDEELASGNTDLAERAYLEGWYVANEEYMRRALISDPKQIGIAGPNVEGFQKTAERLKGKADKAGS